MYPKPIKGRGEQPSTGQLKKDENMTTYQITKLNENGDGIASVKGREMPVPFTLPGDEVELTFFEHKKQLVAELKSVVKPSPNRVQPVCRHFGECGGCSLQHADDVTYKAFKKGLVVAALERFGLDSDVVAESVILPAGRRRRVNFEAKLKNGQLTLGFHKRRTHFLVDLQECHTIMPEMRILLEPLHGVLAFALQNNQKAQLFLTTTKAGIDLWLEIQDVSSLDTMARGVLAQFAAEVKLARLIFRHRKTVDIIYQSAEPVVQFGGVDVDVDAFGFLQASDDADEALTSLVMGALPENTQKIADLFCGRGTFTLPLSLRGAVEAYEFDKRALVALDKAIERSKRPVTTHFRNLFEESLTAEELNAFDVVVIDPPRAGAEHQCAQFQDTYVQKIVYVSCHPDTFARDAKILIESGYVLEKATPVDQFPWAAHVEVVGVFKLNTHS